MKGIWSLYFILHFEAKDFIQKSFNLEVWGYAAVWPLRTLLKVWSEVALLHYYGWNHHKEEDKSKQ